MPLITLFPGTSHEVVMEVFSPPSTVVARGVSIVVAYGTDGLSTASKPLIEDFCTDLTKAGYTVAVPRFLEITRTTPGFGPVTAALTSANLALWTSALVEGVSWCTTKQGSDRIALIGFSLGGYMSARTALATPVKYLIDFFGPMRTFGLVRWPTGEAFDGVKAAGLPPTQIHHGNQDLIVDPSESTALESWLTAAHIPCDLHTNYNCGHPQQPDGTPWTAAEQTQALPHVLRVLATL